MEYVVIRSAYNRVIEADSDAEAWDKAEELFTKPRDIVFVVKSKDLVKK